MTLAWSYSSFHSAGAVATGPREITTVQHCASPEWEYLTFDDYMRGLPPGHAVRVQCTPVRPFEGYDDGWCTYSTDRYIEHWSPRVSRDCQDERVSSVHHATGSAFAPALGYSYDSPARGWLRVSMPLGPGASGAPVWCGEDLIGVYALTRFVVTW